jgi:xylulokinase
LNTYVGIDVGTTGLKVSVVDEHGAQIVSASREYPISTPRPGWAEQDPEHWWRALVEACAEITQQNPSALGSAAAISLCGQMHTQVLLDADGEIIRPAITWMDQRSSAIVDRINSDRATAATIVDHTQNRLTTTYTAAHLAWIRENEPDAWKRVDSMLIAKDFLKYRLTGRRVIDFSEASGTLLFDNVREAWW